VTHAPGAAMVLGTSDGPDVRMLESAGRAHAVVWPGTGAQLRSMHRISLPPGARTLELSHPSDAVYYVIAGGGQVADREAGSEEPLVEGSMIHVDRGTTYRFAAGGDGLELVGGPAPTDPALYPEAG
jgi:mannose-6-phosphate isomerase-like protein (cupin superfamily)